METSVKSTSVIIPCWNIDETLNNFTQRCVASVRDTSDVELIIIDNGSTHGQEFMRDNADIYVRNSTNLGYVKAINQGIKLSSGEYIVCGNNDYMMTEGWDVELKACLREVKECGIACPHVKGSPKQETPWAEHGTPGGWYMIKAETIMQIGLLDERWKNVFADFDFCWRMRKHGLYIHTTPYVTVEHYGEASMSKYKQRTKEWEEGSKMLIDKWKGDPFMGKHLKELGLREQD